MPRWTLLKETIKPFGESWELGGKKMSDKVGENERDGAHKTHIDEKLGCLNQYEAN